jgi:hypothetical protein
MRTKSAPSESTASTPPSAPAVDQISSMQQTLLQREFSLILCSIIGSSALFVGERLLLFD